jgi:uncharacterized protein (TIGR03067 family)
MTMARRGFVGGPRTESEARAEPQELHSLEEESWDEPELPEQRARAELELLQGPWFSVLGRRQAELLIAGGHFTIRFEDDIIYMGTFELDPDARPRAMDMRIDEGPASHKGKTALCIYELTGDTLRWCVARPGSKERLAGFPSEYNANYLYLAFRREKPNAF